ncbi:MAG TPA: helix-turn-helix domain-containing protein [Gemmatimonadaceae bacterium]
MPATATARRPRNRAIGNPIERAIRTEREHASALREMELLLESSPRKGSGEYDRLELLSILVEAYEEENTQPLPGATPQELVEFMAEQKGMDRTTLADLFGGRSRLSDFLNDKRQLSLGQIARLKRALGIPADLLVG